MPAITPVSSVGSPAASAALAFTRVTVVDVTDGTLHRDQTVVISGMRITAVGAAHTIRLPAGAQQIDARGKYLIPGLWDMHTHPADQVGFAYPLYLANGVTGIRNAGTWVPIDTMRRWQREILAGRRVGPPRQLITGPALDEGAESRAAGNMAFTMAAGARRVVDSLHAAGADFIKVHDLGRELFFAIAAEARRQGIAFSGHLAGNVTVSEASDSGQHGLDHIYSLPPECVGDSASLERCTPMVARLRRNDTWLIPTAELITALARPSGPQLHTRLRYLPDTLSRRHWPADSGDNSPGRFIESLAQPAPLGGDAPRPGVLTTLRRAGGDALVLAGTDVGAGQGMVFALMPGFSVHDQMAGLVAAGLSPLGALQAATLHPAQFAHASDSLGTIATGKLADLVLLDANPLEDIRNTTTIRAVVANGRYFDRAALDAVLAAVEQTGDARWR